MLYYLLVITLILTSVVSFGIFWYKDIFTRILFLNSATSLSALFISILGSIKVNSSYIDIALIYFFLSVIASLAYLKYFMHKHKDEYKNAK